MKIQKAESVVAVPLDCEGAKDAEIRVLIGGADGAPNFFMRQFTLQPGGHTPRHAHDWEHEAFVLSGNGVIVTAEGPRDVSAGEYVFIPTDELHQFKNTGPDEMKFLCLIPRPSED